MKKAFLPFFFVLALALSGCGFEGFGDPESTSSPYLDHFFSQLPQEEREAFMNRYNTAEFLVGADRRNDRVLLKVPIRLLIEEIDKRPNWLGEKAREILKRKGEDGALLLVFWKKYASLWDILFYDDTYTDDKLGLVSPDAGFDPRTRFYIVTYPPLPQTFLVDRDMLWTTHSFDLAADPHHPQRLDLSKDGKTLYVAAPGPSALLNTVDLKTGKVVETLDLSAYLPKTCPKEYFIDSITYPFALVKCSHFEMDGKKPVMVDSLTGLQAADPETGVLENLYNLSYVVDISRKKLIHRLRLEDFILGEPDLLSPDGKTVIRNNFDLVSAQTGEKTGRIKSGPDYLLIDLFLSRDGRPFGYFSYDDRELELDPKTMELRWVENPDTIPKE